MLFDWIDPDNIPFTGIPGAAGAEQSDYLLDLPRAQVKNKRLDRLGEIRAIKRVAESRIAWRDWESRFTIYEPSAGRSNLYPGLLNVNSASYDQIVAFLKARSYSGADRLSSEQRDVQIVLNRYADDAEEIAAELTGEGSPLGELGFGIPSRRLSKSDAERKVKSASGGGQRFSQVFSTYDEYFLVRIVIAVGESQAEISAVLYTPRKSDRTATGAEVLEYSLN